jgi:tetratricopeptide (TPR) repeat protein
MLIQKGSMDEGLGCIKKATEIAPESADWHMNYGSMLFMKGQQVFQSQGKDQSMPIFIEAEKELLSAIKLFGQADVMLIAQCYFILGEIYFYVREDKTQAKAFYQQSLDHDPNHGGSAAAMKRVQ